MKFKFNVENMSRRELVEKLENIVGEPAKYLGMPSAAYKVGSYTVELDGTVTFENSETDRETEEIIKSFAEQGLISDIEENEIEPFKKENVAIKSHKDADRLTIQMPRSYFTYEALKNLKKLIKNKETLIKKALDVPKLRIEVTDETVSFPWFNETDGDIVKAYTQFIEALCKMAKEVKRVVSKEKPIENEKYAFRCFLLRLGFIGPEYSQSRKLLLKNLEGSSAFKNGGACHAVSEQRSS